MKKIAQIVDALISMHRWDETFDALGSPSRVHVAIRDLLLCEDLLKIHEIYWGIENVVVVQGQVYESALPCLEVLLMALVKCELPEFVKCEIYNVIFQVIAGYPAREAIDRGNSDIVEKCQALVSQVAYFFIHDVEIGSLDTKTASEILGLLGWSSEIINAALYI